MNALARWWFSPAPALRLALVRALVGLYCVIFIVARGTSYTAVGELPASRFEPVGVARVLTAPLPSGLLVVLVALTAVLGVAFTLGWRHRVVGPAFALAFLWIATYRNCWGHVGHGDHLVVLHLLVLGFAPSADAAALGRRNARPLEGWRYGWPLKLMPAST